MTTTGGSRYAKNTEVTTSLTLLPLELLQEISTYLPYEDLVSFSTTHPVCYPLQPGQETVDTGLPQFLYDPRLAPPLFEPRTFERQTKYPVYNKGIKEIKGELYWHNESHREGYVWMELVRSRKIVANTGFAQGGIVPPHSRGVAKLNLNESNNSAIIKQAQLGDVLQLKERLIGTFNRMHNRTIIKIIYKTS